MLAPAPPEPAEVAMPTHLHLRLDATQLLKMHLSLYAMSLHLSLHAMHLHLSLYAMQLLKMHLECLTCKQHLHLSRDELKHMFTLASKPGCNATPRDECHAT
eukprot:3616790-Lingulodinium_polyedra.AAC.1